MDFDGIDGGEHSSYASMRSVARQDILGYAADGHERGEPLNWRAAVKRHPFFHEVTNAAQQQGEELGSVIGTAVGLLQSLVSFSHDIAHEQGQGEGSVDSQVTEGRSTAMAHLDQLRLLVSLYQSSPVPTRRSLRRALEDRASSSKSATPPATQLDDGSEDDESADDGDDDGSAASESLRVAMHSVVQEIKRGSLKYLFKSWGAATAGGGSATRKAILQVLETYVDQNRPAVSGGGAAPAQRLDDW